MQRLFPFSMFLSPSSCGSFIDDETISVSFCYNHVVIAQSATDQCFCFWCSVPSGKGLQAQRMRATCTHEQNGQNGKNSVLGQGAYFISFERCERCEMGARRGYIYMIETITSLPVLLQHSAHPMSMYYFTLGEKKQANRWALLPDTSGEQKLPPFKSPHLSITLFCLFVYLEDQ